MPKTETEAYGPDEDAEYLSVFWGILRVPVVCAECGTRTRTPCYGEDGRHLCGRCYRGEMWPPQASAQDVADPPPSAPDEVPAAARPTTVARGSGKGRPKAKAATVSGRPKNGRRGRGVTGGPDGP